MLSYLKQIKTTISQLLRLKHTIDDSVNARTSIIVRKTELTQLALNSTEPGVTKEKIAEEEVIVSLTSYGGRYYEAYLAVESIMQGTVKPNRIILWVGNELKDEPIPVTLQRQMKRGLEVRFCKDIRSYTKLIYSLREFPEASIITIDDDVMYEHDVIENLLNVHNRHPEYICANDVSIIPSDFTKKQQTYWDWPMMDKYKQIESGYVAQGYSGVLYPPHCLSDEVFNEKVFLDICRTADDVWFSTMAMLKGTKCMYAYPHIGKFRFVNNEDVQTVALMNMNCHGSYLNDVCIQKVFGKYNIV